MTGRTGALALFALITVLYPVGIGLTLLAGEPLSLNELLMPVFYAFAVVGVLVALNRPRNAVGWLCLGIGLVWGMEALLWGAALYGFAHPVRVPQPGVLAAIGDPLWIPGIFLTGTFVLILFPDGRLPSPRWRWLAWLTGGAIAFGYLLSVVSQPTTASWGRPQVENPIAQHLLGTPVLGEALLSEVFDLLLVVVVPVGVIGAVSALVVRYRRSSGMERHQLKWLVTAGTAVVLVFIVSVFVTDYLGDWVGLVAAGGFILMPISIAVAILRYRLYEIDRILSRTVSYTVLVGALAAMYAGIVLGLPRLVGIPEDSTVLVALATLAAAALFQPARRRLQARVDRHFNRARFDAQQEVDHFTDRLRTEVDLHDLTGEALAVVAKTLQPSQASVWIKKAPNQSGP